MLTRRERPLPDHPLPHKQQSCARLIHGIPFQGATMGRPVIHFEIGCRDAAKTEQFYSKLFDW
jgi:hypothetical protein